MSDTATTSSKRAEANRRNAQKSTGPTSQAGRDKTRFNALKHGMRARLPVLPGEDGASFRARLDTWTASLEPRDDLERYLVERAVNVSWQLDRADRAWAARLKADLLSAGSAQALAQADEALILGRRLFWDPRGPVELYPQYKASIGDPMRVSWSQDIEDPDEPARLVNRLEGTTLGCAWLLDRWNELGDLLEDGLKWQAPDRFKATRLLGKQPLEPLDDLQVRWIHLCVSAMDPECKGEFNDLRTELDSAEWKRFVERLEARDAWREKPEEAEVARAALLELVSEQEERLETLLAAHLERESAADPDALGFQDTAEGERLRRYQMACNRTLLRILETLRKRHRESDQAKGGGKRTRKSPGAESRVESATEADLLREPFAPVIAQGQEPVGESGQCSVVSGQRGPLSPTVGLPIHENVTNEATDPLFVGRESPAPTSAEGLPLVFTDHGPLSTDHSPQGSPGPAPSPTEGHPIDQIATNEATTLPNCENATNEATAPREHAPRTIHVLPAIVVAFLALLFGAGISAAFGASANGTDPNSLRQLHFVERPRILAEISTIPRDNRPRPLSSD